MKHLMKNGKLHIHFQNDILFEEIISILPSLKAHDFNMLITHSQNKSQSSVKSILMSFFTVSKNTEGKLYTR